MNLFEMFQNLVAQVPELVQPLIVALAGAVPFIEGEGAATIGIVGGIAPVVAAVAAMIGNFACVTVVVLLASRARSAIVIHHERSRDAVLVGAGAGPRGGSVIENGGARGEASAPESGRKAARRAKFQRAFERYGVPGVSLLGPMLLPTQFTATMLVAAGIAKGRVLAWQAVAIFLWTTALTVMISTAVYAIH